MALFFNTARFPGQLRCSMLLVEQRFPIGRNSADWSWRSLTLRMRTRRHQLHALNRLPPVVIEEPILVRLEAGDDRMPRCGGMHLMHAGTENFHNSRCAHTSHTCANE